MIVSGHVNQFLAGSMNATLTLPLFGFTQGRLTLLMKVTSGGESGYSGPQWILSE